MDKCRKTIAIIEPSNIIFEGFTSLLMRTEKHFFFYRLDDLEELNPLSATVEVNIAIVNPMFFQSKPETLVKMRRQYPDISWIGIVYSLFDERLLAKFDEIISISDSKETIIEKISRINTQCCCNEFRHDDLSDRETEVLVLLVDGLSNKEIADKLHISIHTVISHRRNISDKTGVKSLSGLTIYAISKKIVNPLF